MWLEEIKMVFENLFGKKKKYSFKGKYSGKGWKTNSFEDKVGHILAGKGQKSKIPTIGNEVKANEFRFTAKCDKCNQKFGGSSLKQSYFLLNMHKTAAHKEEMKKERFKW
jgi:hypothetical protein